MPSQFQPYYPVRRQPAAAATPASGQGVGSSMDKLIKAILQQRQNAAANALATDPDPDWLYTNAQPSAVAASPGSYY